MTGIVVGVGIIFLLVVVVLIIIVTRKREVCQPNVYISHVFHEICQRKKPVSQTLDCTRCNIEVLNEGLNNEYIHGMLELIYLSITQ